MSRSSHQSASRRNLLSDAVRTTPLPAFEGLEDRRLMAATPVAPVGLTVRPDNASEVQLAWTDRASNETGFEVQYKVAGHGGWHHSSDMAADATSATVAGLSNGTRYFFRVRAFNSAGDSKFSNTAKLTLGTGSGSSSNSGNSGSSNSGSNTGTGTTVPPQNGTVTPAAVYYSAPIVITHGGTYTGNWQSNNPNVAAVRIATNQPVVIQNSNISSRGNLIEVDYGVAANLTVQNTNGYALNPNVYGRSPGRFLDAESFSNIVLKNNYMQGTAGTYLYNYMGNHTAYQTVKILNNRAQNIDGRFSNGNNGYLTSPDANDYVQFFQINGVHNLVGAEVAWNQVVNLPGQSRVEDNISIHNTTGTSYSPVLIHDNYIQGAYPADPAHDTSYTGGGIMLADNGSSYVRAYNNQVVATSNYGIAVSSGRNNSFSGNRIVSSGLLPSGQPIASANIGAYIWNMNGETTFTNNSGSNNTIGWNGADGRNDAWTPDASSWTGNVSMGGTITRATETAEWNGWLAKVARAGARIGPVV